MVRRSGVIADSGECILGLVPNKGPHMAEQCFECGPGLHRLELAERNGGVGGDVVVSKQIDEQPDRQGMT